MRTSSTLRVLFVTLFVVGISLLHYFTPLHIPQLHDLFQRLYYIPIIFAGFWFGMRGGLSASVVTSVLYAPHILFQWGARPTLEPEKFLEIVLYNVVGGVTGYLSEKEEARRAELERTARGLEESYRKLQAQADMIIRIEEQLRGAERLSALGELAAVLAHEIRNPLGSIKGTAEILKDDLRPGDRKYEFLEILLKETDRLNNVVENFLGLARPVATEPEKLDLGGEIRELAALQKQDFDAAGVALEVDLEDVPALRGDREKLRQALLNLILNALQATPRGGRVTVTARNVASTEETGAGVEVTVADSGTGIPPEAMERIFQPFFTTRGGGTGLGLSITQKIIEGHGGRITAASPPGRGAVFTIRLPLIDSRR